MSAAAAAKAPFARVAMVHAIAIPLALAIAPAVVPWPLVAAAAAVVLTPLLRLPVWWVAINAVFLPALMGALALSLSPLWALAGFSGLALVYGAIWRTRVPLFFSSRKAREAIASLLPQGAISFVDLGCGDGRVISKLATARPESRFEGVEHALLPWLLAKLRCRWGRVTRGSLWSLDLGAYDVVYAYLSPAVMERLWAKARREMGPGAVFISAFAVPGVASDSHIDIDDVVGTRLHVWRMGGQGA